MKNVSLNPRHATDLKGKLIQIYISIFLNEIIREAFFWSLPISVVTEVERKTGVTLTPMKGF